LSDVVVAVDSSSSIDSTEWSQFMQFVDKLIDAFPISQQGMHMANIQFGNTVKVIKNKGQVWASTNKAAKEMRTNIVHGATGSNTNMNLAADEALKLFSNSRGAVDVLLVVTDGLPTGGTQAGSPSDVAFRKARAQGKEVLFVLIGDLFKWLKLPSAWMSAEPVQISNFAALEKAHLEVIKMVCKTAQDKAAQQKVTVPDILKIPPTPPTPPGTPSEEKQLENSRTLVEEAKKELKGECEKTPIPAERDCMAEWMECAFKFPYNMRACSNARRPCFKLNKQIKAWKADNSLIPCKESVVKTVGTVSSPAAQPPAGEQTLAPFAPTTVTPSKEPTVKPTGTPTQLPTTLTPTEEPTASPTETPTEVPTTLPPTTVSRPWIASVAPTHTPTEEPTAVPTVTPTEEPTRVPMQHPTLLHAGSLAATGSLVATGSLAATGSLHSGSLAATGSLHSGSLAATGGIKGLPLLFHVRRKRAPTPTEYIHTGSLAATGGIKGMPTEWHAGSLHTGSLHTTQLVQRSTTLAGDSTPVANDELVADSDWTPVANDQLSADWTPVEQLVTFQ
jgi:hypothetical protein